MSKQSDKRQAAELAKLLPEIARDLGAGVPATDLCAAFQKAMHLACELDRGFSVTRGVHGPDDGATKYFKKRYGVESEGLPFVQTSFNPGPAPDPQSARARAVCNLLVRLQDGRKPDTDDLAALLALADSLQPTADAQDGEYVPATIAQTVMGFPTYKTFTKWLGRHQAEIRTYKPSKQRLMVHMGDALACKATKDKLESDAADRPAEEVADEYAALIEARTARERDRKASKGAPRKV